MFWFGLVAYIKVQAHQIQCELIVTVVKAEPKSRTYFAEHSAFIYSE